MPGPEVPGPNPIPLVYLIRYGPGRFIALVHDEPNDEVTHIAYRNTWLTDWDVVYTWKNQSDQEFTIPAGTGYTTIGIPPGQRKFVPLTGDRNGFDSEVAKVVG